MAETKIPKPIQVVDIEAYSPPQIALRIDRVATAKAKLSFAQTFILGILAGVYIGIGAQFATLVISDSTLHFGLNSLIAGIVFSLGLMLVISSVAHSSPTLQPHGLQHTRLPCSSPAP